MSIFGNVIGGGSAPLKTVILEDDFGNQMIGVVTESVQIFDAKPSDVKAGKKFVSDIGICEGTDTKNYRVEMSTWLVFPGENCSIPLSNYDIYDYTGFQCIITLFSQDYSTNATTIGVSIGDSVFSTQTSKKISNIVKNVNTKSIDLNIVNNSEDIYSIRYFTYRVEV